LVKPGGLMIALKGAGAQAEAQAATGALRKLGGQWDGARSFRLPGGDERSLIFLKKISQTPTVYPRNGGKIAKSPL